MNEWRYSVTILAIETEKAATSKMKILHHRKHRGQSLFNLADRASSYLQTEITGIWAYISKHIRGLVWVFMTYPYSNAQTLA